MPDFTLEQANRAASGIRPVVTVPGASGTPVTGRRAQLFAKPAPEVLRILSEVHRRKPTTGTRPLPIGTPERRPIGAAKVPILPIQRREQPIRIGASGYDAERLMTACIGGQFLVENKVGRTKLAKAIVAQARSTGRRDGMDGLLLTALLHLQAAKDTAAGEALDTWRNTVGSAGTGNVPAFDAGTGQIGTVAAGTLKDPFADGLARPKFVDDLEQAHGGHVTSWEGWVSAGCTIAGAVIGGIVGGAAGGVVGAGVGAFGGAEKGHDFGDKIIGWLKEWFGGDEKGDTAKDAAPEAPKDASGTEQPKEAPPPPPKDESGGGDDGGGGDDDPPKETGWPPDNPGYPPPDGDGGGGNPWDRIGFGPLVAMSRARAMAKLDASGVANIASIPAFAAVGNAVAPQLPVFTQVGANALKNVQLDPVKLQSAVTAVKAVAVNAGRIGPAAVKQLHTR